MLISAAFSFILYSLVFLRLSGDFTVSEGYKAHIGHRSELKVGSAGTHIVTDGLTMVAKQMLPHPIAYTVLVLPICTTAYCTPSDAPLPFLATVCTTTVFLLGGFVNVVLFCATRDALPGSWKQKSGIDTTSYGVPSDTSLSGLTDRTRRPAKTGGRIDTKPAPITVSITVEKDIETNCKAAESTASSPRCSRTTFPIQPPRAYDGMQRDDSYRYSIRKIPFPPPLRIRLEGDHFLDENPSAGVHLASRADRFAWRVSEQPEHLYRGRESGVYRPPPDFEAPPPVHPFATTLPPVNAKTLKP